MASRPQHPSAGPQALHPSQKIKFFAPMIVSTPVDQGVNQRFSPWTPSSYLAIPRRAAEKEQGVQRANHGFALCPAGAGKGVSRNLKFRRRVQGRWSCRGVLGASSHQLQPESPIRTNTLQFQLKQIRLIIMISPESSAAPDILMGGWFETEELP